MITPKYFIAATKNFNTFEKNVPAHYFRRSFYSESACTARISIAVCGFYELYFNEKRITKGFLSPYISNTNDCVYFDEYEIDLDVGENIIGILLGNGFQNNPGGYIWDFDRCDFRSAPKLALTVSYKTDSEKAVILESDTDFKVAPSPIRSDDYRFGEYYDANFEIDGWEKKGFDDSGWQSAIIADAPKGELRMADVAPIVKECEIRPIGITEVKDGYIYDFGMSNSGVCRLRISGKKGQKIELQHADSLHEGDLNIAQVWFVRDFWERDKGLVHKDTYICRGDGTEVYQPSFTYHGFRYVKVSGITKEQATEDLITFAVYHTELHARGDFECSSKTATKIQEITKRSILSNFHHFPTDCPQREKNGWTADAALSCEAALLNFDPERNYREWMHNICKAQSKLGSLPGIVPTGGWGFDWGNGPAWDCVLAYLPYFTYVYRGETEMIRESHESFIKYLGYLRTRTDENGLLSIGLGDWCHVGNIHPPKAPLILTDSVMAMDIARKISVMLKAIGMINEAAYALDESEKYRDAIREHLIDRETLIACGSCQSSQAMCLFYGVFDESEKDIAFEKLLCMIREFDDHIDVGVLGGRVIFHVLSDFGYSDLAFKMITREDFPSYGNWLKRGATTLWENFIPEDSAFTSDVSSMNHHFWGDVSAWFIKCVAGININPSENDARAILIRPSFIDDLDDASAYHVMPIGRVSSKWTRVPDGVILDLEIPDNASAVASLPSGFAFEDLSVSKAVTSGRYKIIRI
ncbi:MAG: family 78 glycoside hydrolase catalytic domain [Clostridia bacterium]|nr:family 78 glycoside hydrolase catalytic domain [Clostridia bacterium]MBQ9749038.1 family 78 glycoside hydrolase catalytic domain [Clostridia bacterium]